MKYAAILIILFVFAFCKNNTENETTYDVDSTKNKFISFVDSIKNLNPEKWIKEVTHVPDSLFYEQQNYLITLSSEDFEELKEGCREEKLSIEFLERLFPNFRYDTEYFEANIAEGYLPIKFYSFDKNKFDFNYFAIQPGGETYHWDCLVYFFEKNKLISRHDVYHKYGFEMNYFTDADGKIVIYYKRNFNSGTGIWWFNYYFYKYYDGELIPVLNELQNANQQFPWGSRSFWLESKIIDTNPLTMKMVYYSELPDTSEYSPIKIIDDSTEVVYNWNENKKIFIPDFTNSKLDRNKILSYYILDNDLLFIYSHNKIFNNLLTKQNELLKKVTKEYLNEVMVRLDNDNN